jgi:hypothetical protein
MKSIFTLIVVALFLTGCQSSDCSNGQQDGNETGVDCGGDCVPCNSSANSGEISLRIRYVVIHRGDHDYTQGTCSWTDTIIVNTSRNVTYNVSNSNDAQYAFSFGYDLEGPVWSNISNSRIYSYYPDADEVPNISTGGYDYFGQLLVFDTLVTVRYSDFSALKLSENSSDGNNCSGGGGGPDAIQEDDVILENGIYIYADTIIF